MYGARFVDMWSTINAADMKTAWAEELAGFTKDELVRGLETCKTKPFPPTLPEFMEFCRPKLSAKAEWFEACEQMRIRLQGEDKDRWTRPQVYWAAVKIGWHDLNSLSWDAARARWEAALAGAKSDPVPEFMKALPKPGEATPDKNQAAKFVAEIAKQFRPGEPGNQWAKSLIERHKNGEAVMEVSLNAACEALGIKRSSLRGEHG